MNIDKKFLPLIVSLSVILGAVAMFVVMQVTDGTSAEPVLNDSGDADTELAIDQDDGEENAAEEAVETSGSEISEDKAEKFHKAYSIIMDRYVEAFDEEELLEGAINGMLEVLDDPYSVYMDQETAREFMDSLDSSFEGIGAEVSMTNGKVTIVAPFRDSPAEKAGLRPNDQIVGIDGDSIEGLSLYEAVLQIRGEKGTTVTLTVERPGVSEELNIDVVRDTIPIETVTSELIEEDGAKIGLIEIRSFSESTATDFEEQLHALEKEGIDGLVIDVRGNPGGFLQSVEDIGNLLVPGGEPIVQIENREGERIRHVSNLEEEKEYPIATLINEGSASASEILAAALKEAGGHHVVGETTFGKGTVQQTLQLGDGSELKLTLFRWLTSDGNDINEVGVEPTEEVRQPDFFYVSPVQAEDPLEFDMNSEQVENAQLMLEGLDYDPGRTDGYFSSETEEAVRAFQDDEGLDVTGVIDEDTAWALQDRVVEAVRDRENDLQFKRAIELLIENE
ncbi:S41 family peptidase [Alteribacter keqinensis]|uniref:PDZ domain-containing protein n=1 Tax=Alteribacter keqinensis TaxID=2483800 RepID=A0A3M7TR80_9BACI|nr:S41 family peptidase [Alteribacter keqinensis]RNA67530.1 PDZ domain-containing protein [Alteribacter keqinensis]